MNSSIIAAALDRQAIRRERKLPTVAVLAGPGEWAERQWHTWAQERGWVVEDFHDAVPERWVPTVVQHIAERIDLVQRTMQVVARLSGREAADIWRSLHNQTLGDFEEFWTGIELPAQDRTGTMAVAEFLCRRVVAREGVSPRELAVELEALLAGGGRPWVRVLVALNGLMEVGDWPALLFSPVIGFDAELWMGAQARWVSEIAEAVPELPLALNVPMDALDAYLRNAGESRGKSLLAAGVVRIEALDVVEMAGQPHGVGGPAEALDRVRKMLDGKEAPEKLVKACSEAARLAETADDGARSAAERFLFELLESLPATSGRFTLNARLDFPFGNQAAEVDLCAVDLKLAVEIDGYHHFTDADGYRRDRRKDWELQRSGYFVLRVLAQDVVRNMEEIVERIVAAMDCCRRRKHGEESDQ